jgi:hypothetical protein
MTTQNAATTDTAAAVAEQGATVAPEKARKGVGPARWRGAWCCGSHRAKQGVLSRYTI